MSLIFPDAEKRRSMLYLSPEEVNSRIREAVRRIQAPVQVLLYFKFFSFQLLISNKIKSNDFPTTFLIYILFVFIIQKKFDCKKCKCYSVSMSVQYVCALKQNNYIPSPFHEIWLYCYFCLLVCFSWERTQTVSLLYILFHFDWLVV